MSKLLSEARSQQSHCEKDSMARLHVICNGSALPGVVVPGLWEIVEEYLSFYEKALELGKDDKHLKGPSHPYTLQREILCLQREFLNHHHQAHC